MPLWTKRCREQLGACRDEHRLQRGSSMAVDKKSRNDVRDFLMFAPISGLAGCARLRVRLRRHRRLGEKWFDRSIASRSGNGSVGLIKPGHIVFDFRCQFIDDGRAVVYRRLGIG